MFPTSGSVRIAGDEVTVRPERVRRHLGVVFQAPALDVRLTVQENLTHQGHLYGLRGRTLAGRIADAMDRVGLTDRAHDLVHTLSGGLQRRAELAKALLHRPAVLVLDEPTTGLDPGARRDVWRHLLTLRERDHTTIVLTTHLMDEAAKCDRVGIMHEGSLVALGTPQALTDQIGGDVILIPSADPAALAAASRRASASRPRSSTSRCASSATRPTSSSRRSSRPSPARLTPSPSASRRSRTCSCTIRGGVELMHDRVLGARCFVLGARRRGGCDGAHLRSAELRTQHQAPGTH